ncbi:MAG: restriction endonuclease, partial [Planctomycetota bacterium]
MSTASLKKYFSAVVAKRLSEVEVNPQRSHQHEFNGTQALKGILGLERRTQIATLLYLSDEEELVRAQCKLTWYDAREADPVRSEHRLYFQHNEVIDSANADDLLILAIRPSGDILIAIATEGSTREQQLQWLFGVEPERDKPFTVSAIPE